MRKGMFRKGATVRLKGEGRSFHGKTGKVLKVNSRTVTVGLGTFGPYAESVGTPWTFDEWSEGEFNVPPSMLEVVA